MIAFINPFYSYVNEKFEAVLNSGSKLLRGKELAHVSKLDFGSTVLAFDEARQRLLVYKSGGYKGNTLVIDLRQLQNCSLKREYSSIKAGELATKPLSHFITSIKVELDFGKENRKIEIPLFSHLKPGTHKASRMESRARLLYKWLNRQIKRNTILQSE